MTTKIAVSLPDHLVEAARAAVAEGRAASVSAYVAEAMTEKQQRHLLGDFLDELDDELGPPAEEDTLWAREQIARLRS